MDDRRDGFRGYFRRASGEVARQFVTPSRHVSRKILAAQIEPNSTNSIGGRSLF
jgi:hypothetical protein